MRAERKVPVYKSAKAPQKRYCRFVRHGIKHVDYKNPDFLSQFVNEFGRILPKRITGTSVKYQKKVSKAVKRARHLGLLPFVREYREQEESNGSNLEPTSSRSGQEGRPSRG